LIPADLEETQEIVRTSFEPELPPMSGDDPLEQTMEIYPNAAVTGTWEPMRRLTPCGEVVTLSRYRK
jgi:hypothetical protein